MKFLSQPDNARKTAIVAFMDIKSAAKAHNSSNQVDGVTVSTQYGEPTGTRIAVASSVNRPRTDPEPTKTTTFAAQRNAAGKARSDG